MISSVKYETVLRQTKKDKQMKIMKTMMVGAVAVVMAFFIAGCDHPLTPEKIEAVATTIGRTAGYACELSKTKTAVREAIAKVLDVIATVVPTENQTFSEAWTPVIAKDLQKLVDAGKLDSEGAKVAKLALGVACDGIDYVFVKYPKAKEVKELMSATTIGFINGYKSVVNLAAGATMSEIDKEAYEYLKAKMAK